MSPTQFVLFVFFAVSLCVALAEAAEMLFGG